MIKQTLGEKINELRQKKDISLRELAKQLSISAPFLSDIELGRRNPSEEVLAKIAEALKFSIEELKKYDPRETIADIKKLSEMDPKMGFAFRTMVEEVKEGKLTAEQIIERLNKHKNKK